VGINAAAKEKKSIEFSRQDGEGAKGPLAVFNLPEKRFSLARRTRARYSAFFNLMSLRNDSIPQIMTVFAI